MSVKWLKPDKKTLKHLALGTVLMAVFCVVSYFFEWYISALFSAICASVVWEYQQYKLKDAVFDIQDIAASCLTGLIFVILLITNIIKI